MTRYTKTYTFISTEGQEVQTSNLVEFCRERKLQRRHIHEVIEGHRKSHRGWSLKEPVDPGMTVGQVLMLAEVAAQQSGDPEYQAEVKERIEAVRRGEQIDIDLPEGDPILAELREAGIAK